MVRKLKRKAYINEMKRERKRERASKRDKAIKNTLLDFTFITATKIKATRINCRIHSRRYYVHVHLFSIRSQLNA